MRKAILLLAFIPSVATAQFSTQDKLVGLACLPDLCASLVGGGDNFIAESTTYTLLAGTLDGSDTARMAMSGGGALSSTRGGDIRLYGNEHASQPGDVSINAGGVTNGSVDLGASDATGTITASTAGLTRLTVEADGDLALDATNGGSIVITKVSTGVSQPAATGLTAAGTTITDALQLTSVYNNVTTAAASTGVKLWNPQVGGNVVVRNGGANNLALYPANSSGTINGGSAGAAITLTTAAKQVANCAYVATNTWFCGVSTGS